MSFRTLLQRVVMVSLAVSCNLLVFCHQVQAESIKFFDTSVRVQKDSTVYVSESIFYDFENVSRYGFSRNIPTTYQRSGAPYSVDFRLLGVTDGDNNPMKTSVTKNDDAVTLTVGDPRLPLTGKHVYRINYVLRNSVVPSGG